MQTNEQMLASAVRQGPEEDTNWLVYADALEENGKPLPAARIRWWIGARQSMRSKVAPPMGSWEGSSSRGESVQETYARLPEWVGRLTAAHAAREFWPEAPEASRRARHLSERYALGLEPRERMLALTESARGRRSGPAGSSRHHRYFADIWALDPDPLHGTHALTAMDAGGRSDWNRLHAHPEWMLAYARDNPPPEGDPHAEPVKLARESEWEEPDHDSLLLHIREHGWEKFADHLQRAGRPGAGLARAKHYNETRGPIYRGKTPWLSLDPDRRGPLVSLALSPSHEGGLLRVMHDFDGQGNDWEPSGDAALGALSSRTYSVRVRNLRHLSRLISDAPRETRRAVLRAALPHLPRGSDPGPVKLARGEPEDSTHNRLIQASAETRDATPLAAFADYLEESGRPGAHLARAGAAHRLAGYSAYPKGAPADMRRFPVVPLGGGVGVAPYAVNGGVWLGVSHFKDGVSLATGRDSLHYVLPVRSRKHLVSLMQDWPVAARAAGWKALAEHLPSTHPDDDKPVQLARLKAPAGGAISGGAFHKGGQFLGRAFRRIREVAAKLAAPSPEAGRGAPVKLARRFGPEPVLGLYAGVRQEHAQSIRERVPPEHAAGFRALIDAFDEADDPRADILRKAEPASYFPLSLPRRAWNKLNYIIPTNAQIVRPQYPRLMKKLWDHVGRRMPVPNARQPRGLAGVGMWRDHGGTYFGPPPVDSSTGRAFLSELRGGEYAYPTIHTSIGRHVSPAGVPLYHVAMESPVPVHALLTAPEYDEWVASMDEDQRPKMSPPSVHLARAGRTTPTAFGNFTDARFEHLPAGYEPQALGRTLTLGELARVERAYGVPARDSLAARKVARGDPLDAPIRLPLRSITALVDRLARRSLKGHALEAALKDPRNKAADKLDFLAAHLLDQYRDYHARHGGATDWYGAPVKELDSTLYDLFGPSGDAEHAPEHARLWSRDGLTDPARNAPANVMFKALIAATSSSANPLDNVLHAYRIWRDGQSRGHDPIVSATPTNEKALERWLAAHGNPPTEVAGNKADPHDAGRWWHRHVYGTPAESAAPGYSVYPAKVYANPNDPNDPLNGSVYATYDSNGKRTLHNKALAAHRDRFVDASLPNPEGGKLSAKGWTIRKKEVAGNLKKLKALASLGYKQFDSVVASLAKSGKGVSSTPESRQAAAYRFAAHWLLTPHDEATWEATRKLTGDALPEWKGLKKTNMLTPAEPMEGAYVFGPKFGPFLLNMHGRLDPLTADKWWTRWWSYPQGKTKESPGGKADRMAMRYAANKAAGQAGVAPAEFQADLWDHAQRAYRSLGGEGMDSYTLADGARAMKQLHEKKPAKPEAREDSIPLARKPDGFDLARRASREAKAATDAAAGGINGSPPRGVKPTPANVAERHEFTAAQHDNEASVNQRLVDWAGTMHLPGLHGMYASLRDQHARAAELHRIAAHLWRGETADAAFKKAILDDPADRTNRLVYADWLDEHDRPEEATRHRGPFQLARFLAAYVSPNTGAGLTTAEAVEQAKEAPTIAGAKKALGFWSDGAEASYVIGAPDEQTLAERAISLGKQFKQKSVLWFAEGDGGDRAHVIAVPERDPGKIHAALARHGVEYKTVVPSRAGSVVHVIDQGGALGPNVNAWAAEAGATRHVVKSGTATYKPLS